jgi:hypothetical protein
MLQRQLMLANSKANLTNLELHANNLVPNRNTRSLQIKQIKSKNRKEGQYKKNNLFPRDLDHLKSPSDL